jgi:glucokinase
MPRKKRKTYWVGFDLGGTKMMAAVFDAELNLVGRARKKTRPQRGARAGLARIVETVNEALETSGVSANSVAGIGVGSPGPLDLEKGVVLDLPNLSWKRVPLKRRLEEAFGCPAAIGNDVDVGVLGEYGAGAAKGADAVLGVFPGTGIGGGFVYRGEVFRGRKYSCMEIGHLRMVQDGALCGCGRRGCLETLASRLAIASAAAAAAYRGEAPRLLALAGMDVSRMRSGVLAQAVREGDASVEAIVRGAARWLGAAVGMCVNVMGPDMVVLGGGLVEAMPVLFCEEVDAEARRTCMPVFAKRFKVRAAKLGDDAGVTGAAWMVRQAVENAGR